MTDDSAALFDCRGLVKTYAGHPALNGAGFSVRRGEVLALLGENGAGKSTLLRLIAGAEKPDAGEMRFRGRSYAPADPAAALHAGVATIHQEPALCPDLTVEDNLMLGREPSTVGFLRRDALRARIDAALARLPHPELRRDRLVRELSPAARQLADIARALVFDAELVIMDEPTSSLSREDAGRLFDVVRRLASDGKAVVYVSHFLEEVRVVADRFTVLRDGKDVLSGSVAESDVSGFIEAMAGRRVDELYPPHRRTAGPVVLSAEALRGTRSPTDASFTLRRGEVLGLAGLGGAGRTELLRVLYALDAKAGGRAVLKGGRNFPSTPADAVRAGCGLLSEDRKKEGLALNLSVADNVALSRLAPYTRGGFVDLGARDRVVDALTARLGVKHRGVRRPVGELSGGNQQKAAFARLLHQEADVLFLDEPTRGVDVRSKAEIYRLIHECASAGAAILLASSYPPELLGTADRIAVMFRGRIGPARPVSEWTESSLAAACAVGRSESVS